MLEVELALDLPRYLVGQLTRAAQLEHGSALGLEQVAQQARVGARAILELVAVALAVALADSRGEPRAAVLVLAAHAIGGVIAHPVLALKLVETGQRGLGRRPPRTPLGSGVGFCVLGHPEAADEHRQRQPLEHERDEDRAVDKQPTQTPVVTTARIAEAPSSSAGS